MFELIMQVLGMLIRLFNIRHSVYNCERNLVSIINQIDIFSDALANS